MLFSCDAASEHHHQLKSSHVDADSHLFCEGRLRTDIGIARFIMVFITVLGWRGWEADCADDLREANVREVVAVVVTLAGCIGMSVMLVPALTLWMEITLGYARWRVRSGVSIFSGTLSAMPMVTLTRSVIVNCWPLSWVPWRTKAIRLVLGSAVTLQAFWVAVVQDAYDLRAKRKCFA